jgi:hypothetical protein
MFTAKLGLIAFWALWFGITFVTNLCSALKARRMLSQRWKFASENYRAVADAASVYDSTGRLAFFLFIVVLVWQFAAAILFAGAAALWWTSINMDRSAANAAFALGLGLWAAFMLADEIFLQYERESPHATIFIAQVVSWMALYVLPD